MITAKKFSKITWGNLLILIFVLVPFVMALNSLSVGTNFWFDNARDLLSAWDNLEKPTLIGPPSGIPGIFYGPYWIWLLSTGLVVSKDPRVVSFLIAALPYFIIFPFIWFKFRKFFTLNSLILGWVLFIFSTGMKYATELWNPFPAPLLSLVVIYLLLNLEFIYLSKKLFFKIILIGFLIALIINFHISFGIGFTLGALAFILYELILKAKISLAEKIKFIGSFLAGFFLASIPFFLFEFRHGFNQIAVILSTLNKYGAVVSVNGLTKYQILQEFINLFAKIIHVPPLAILIILPLCIVLFFTLVKKKKIYLTKNDIKIITLSSFILIGISFIYFTARNPVWSYHFIGVEIIYIIFICLFLSKFPILNKALLIVAMLILVTTAYAYFKDFDRNSISIFEQQKNMVHKISKDGGKSSYSVISYTPSIYMYEYSYLFRWLENKYISFDPSQNAGSEIIYLIVPKEITPKIQDFINYRLIKYTTVDKWEEPNGVIILKGIKS